MKHWLVNILKNLSPEWGVMLPLIALGLPAFLMVGALMTAIGVMVNEVHEAQQTVFIFVLPFMITFWMEGLIVEHPESPMTYFLSFFPLTALPTYCLRLSFTRVPMWQAWLSVAIMCLCALGAVWLASRAFRIGMLRYGKHFSLGEIFKKRAS